MAKFDKGLDFRFGANVKAKKSKSTKPKGSKRVLTANQKATAHFYIGKAK